MTVDGGRKKWWHKSVKEDEEDVDDVSKVSLDSASMVMVLPVGV
jgi:hypothetical protein